MAEPLTTRLKHAWNAFLSKDEARRPSYPEGYSYGFRPDRVRLNISNERSIISSIYTRIGIDVAAVNVRHVRVDEEDQYVETIQSGLNRCLTLEANIDQSARAFIQDAAMTLFDEGVIAIVPVDTTLDPTISGGYDVKTIRVGKVRGWFPRHVLVDLYDDRPGKGKREEILLPKNVVAIVENPLYAVMNEPNSTLQRLITKLNLLDAIDQQSGSGKLDLIIQLPYVIKTEARRQQAEARRTDIEMQLQGSKYGIAYVDGTERVTQLNRPAENNLLGQITYLTNMLYGQLGLTEGVFNGTADEKTMINYYNRTVEPVLSAIVDGMKRKFLTETARTRNQSIMFFRDPFKLVPVNELAEIADKFVRNEILSGNEFRGVIGRKPSKDPKADELRNPNVGRHDPLPEPEAPSALPLEVEGEPQNGRT